MAQTNTENGGTGKHETEPQEWNTTTEPKNRIRITQSVGQNAQGMTALFFMRYKSLARKEIQAGTCFTTESYQPYIIMYYAVERDVWWAIFMSSEQYTHNCVAECSTRRCCQVVDLCQSHSQYTETLNNVRAFLRYMWTAHISETTELDNTRLLDRNYSSNQNHNPCLPKTRNQLQHGPNSISYEYKTHVSKKILFLHSS